MLDHQRHLVGRWSGRPSNHYLKQLNEAVNVLQGATEQGATEQGATEQGATEQGATEQGATEQGEEGSMPEGPAVRTRRAGARESVLDAIRTSEPLSRVELAKITGLTEASVSTTVRRLLDEGLVVETGRTPTGGKPRTLLRLDPAARIAVGVHRDEDVTTYVLTGQTGGVISRMTRPVVAGARQLATDIRALVDGSGLDRVRCLGVGLVGHDSFGPQLSAELGWPVLVENDATAAAVGEYWARGSAARSFAALYMGSTLGAGVVISGEVRGGGQFGHICVAVEGPPCWCGSRGCLEVLAGPQAVVAAAPASLGLGPDTPVAAGFAAVARAARAGSPECRALLDRSAAYVAAAAESVVNMLDVDLLVLTGPGFAAASFAYVPAITARIAPADAKTWHRAVSVTVSLAAATASATGAAALVLQSALSSPTGGGRSGPA